VTTSVEISELRPTYWHLDRKKLEAVLEVWRRGEESLLPPILVTTIDNEVTLIDGHCRAYVALINGETYILASWENIEKAETNCHLFKNFHQKCLGQGIMTIKDLEKRIFDLAETGDIDTAESPKKF
jgi:hypothetical protein